MAGVCGTLDFACATEAMPERLAPMLRAAPHLGPEGIARHVEPGVGLVQFLDHQTLHASANCVADSVVAFVGRSGQGKSTLAAALHQAGHLAHADDLLAVPGDGDLRAPFGISRIKLNPDSARSVGDDPSAMPLVYPGVSKRSKVILSEHASALDP